MVVTLSLFVLMGTAFATNWVLVERHSDLENDLSAILYQTPYNAYVDADSVIKDGDHLIFWEKNEIYFYSGKCFLNPCRVHKLRTRLTKNVLPAQVLQQMEILYHPDLITIMR